MLRNYFRIAWRNLWKNRTFTILNLGGLTISLAACLIIFLWASDEINYDKAAANGDRVFRAALILKVKDQPDKSFAVTAPQLAGVMKKDIPEVEKSIRIIPSKVLVTQHDNGFYPKQFIFADPDFFAVFGYKLIKGNPNTVLADMHSAVVTESMAKQLFGDEDPIGKTISFSDTCIATVTGVAADLPDNTHFHFEIVCSFKYFESLVGGPNNLGGWWNDSYYTYVLLKDAKSKDVVDAKIAHIIDKYNHEGNVKAGLDGIHYLQPLRDIHLHSNLRSELNPNGSLSSLRIFIGIAIFLLVVACINYINLSTATSLKRAREIGMRKVVGAEWIQLVSQFLSESVLTAFIALLLALGLAQLVLPAFNTIAQTQISFSGHITWQFVGALTIFIIVIGIISGMYPALFLSRVKPANAFKNTSEKSKALLPFRKVLVVFQFTLSILLIVATIIAVQQLNYMRSQNIGLDKDQVVAIPVRNYAAQLQLVPLIKELEKKSGVISVTGSSATPGENLANIVVLPEGVADDKMQTMSTLVLDFDFINTYKLNIASGRAFSKDFGEDSSAFMLNETAVKDLGWTNTNAIGKNFNWGLGKKGKVIGVVRDFHFNSLQSKIPAIVMHVLPVRVGWYGFISVRLKTQNASEVLNALQEGWKTILPSFPFEYYFVDEDYDKQYKNERRLSSLAVVFSALTIFISCLGLFGLVLIAVSRRTKEIGIRKVLGASVGGIATLISKDFLKLVALAILIAIPAGWWLMNEWVNDFPYHTQIHGWVFVAAAVIAVLIAIATISLHAISAALANPVKSLRSE